MKRGEELYSQLSEVFSPKKARMIIQRSETDMSLIRFAENMPVLHIEKRELSKALALDLSFTDRISIGIHDARIYNSDLMKLFSTAPKDFTISFVGCSFQDFPSHLFERDGTSQNLILISCEFKKPCEVGRIDAENSGLNYFSMTNIIGVRYFPLEILNSIKNLHHLNIEKVDGSILKGRDNFVLDVKDLVFFSFILNWSLKRFPKHFFENTFPRMQLRTNLALSEDQIWDGTILNELVLMGRRQRYSKNLFSKMGDLEVLAIRNMGFRQFRWEWIEDNTELTDFWIPFYNILKDLKKFKEPLFKLHRWWSYFDYELDMLGV